MPFTSIPITELDDRRIIRSSRPKPIFDRNGLVLDSHGRAQFNIDTDRISHADGKKIPLSIRFFERYVWSQDACTYAQFKVFSYLASTTTWAKLAVLTDENNKPIINKHGEGKVVILIYGNYTKKRTIENIAAKLGMNKDVVRKALAFWEKEGVIKRIEAKQAGSKRAIGRPTDFRRYEIDPDYVWNGPNWAGVALALDNIKFL